MTKPVLIRDILQSRKEVPFYNQIDVLAIEDDVLIGVSGNLTAGFRVQGIDIPLKSAQETAHIVEFLRKTLSSLPEKIQHQFVLKKKAGPGKPLYDYKFALRSKDEIAQALAQSKFSALKSDKLFNTEVFLFITKPYKSEKKGMGKFTFLDAPAIQVSKEDFENQKNDLASAVSLIENAFGNLKIGLHRLKEKDLTQYFYAHLNPTRASKIPLGPIQPDPVNDITLRSKLLYSAPVIEREHFYQDGYYYQGVNLLVPPDQTDLSSLEKVFGQLTTPYEFSLSFYIPDNEKEVEKLKTKANVSKTLGFIGSSKNYDAAQKYSEIDALITEIKSTSQKLAYFSLSFLIRDKDFNLLKKKSDKITQSFSIMGSASAIADHMNHDRLYLSFLPGQAELNPRQFLIQTDALANLLPIQAGWRGTFQARTLFKSRRSELVKLDIFDNTLPARHGLILGTTGSGKSFTTNFILTSYLSDSHSNQLVIIDVGNSYRRLASIFNGSYFDIDLAGQYALNPLVSKEILFPDGELDSETLAYLGLIVEKLVKSTPKDELSNADKRIIEKSILATYQKKSNPLLGDLLATLQNYDGDLPEKERALIFSKNLGIWTEGRYGKLLNRPGNIDVSNRFLVFELGKLDQYPDLQSLIFFVIRSAISGKLYKPDLRKVIVIDEGWRFFNDEVGSRLIEDLYRTARKFNGLVLSISQSPEDFLNTKAASAIISNSFTKYVLKLNKGHEVLKGFDFNDSEISAVKSLVSKPGHFSELFVKFGENAALLKLEPTHLEYWIATTDPEDMKTESLMKEKNPGFKSLALLQRLAGTYPKGMRAVLDVAS